MSIKSSVRTLAARLAKQAKAREKSIERAQKHATKTIGGRLESSNKKPGKSPTSSPLTEETRPSRPWARVRAGVAGFKLYARSENGKELRYQPWAQELVTIMLQAADEGGVHLCLAWP